LSSAASTGLAFRAAQRTGRIVEVLDVRRTARTVCIGVSLAALLTACSKPMSARDAAEGQRVTAAAASPQWSSARVHEPQTARAEASVSSAMSWSCAPTSARACGRNAEFFVDTVDPWTLETRSATPCRRTRCSSRCAGAWTVRTVRIHRGQPSRVRAPDSRVPDRRRCPAGDLSRAARAPERAGGGTATYLLPLELLARAHGGRARSLALPDPRAMATGARWTCWTGRTSRRRPRGRRTAADTSPQTRSSSCRTRGGP
jgi:hypothetical protein